MTMRAFRGNGCITAINARSRAIGV